MRSNSGTGIAILAAGLGSGVLALLLFAWLAREVVLGETTAFDLWARALVHSHASPALTSVMRLVTLVGTPEVMLPLGAIVCYWLFVTGRHNAAWLIIASFAGGSILDVSLKASFGRVRPEPFFGTPLPASASFPSGHALFSVCFYGVLAVLAAHGARRPLRYVILAFGALLAILIGLSRVYLGVHYPTDVLAGYAAAVMWVSAVSAADRWLHYRRREESRRGAIAGGIVNSGSGPHTR